MQFDLLAINKCFHAILITNYFANLFQGFIFRCMK